ncbi:HHIP-like protein 2 [Anaerolineaceae bacterium]|nr:HHIP-like protein 2 [Anaerolineaceae bacterium]
MLYANRAWLWRGLLLSLAVALAACVAVVPTMPEVVKALRTATPRARATLQPQIRPAATQRGPATATDLPAISYQLLPLANGFERPVYLTHAGDGSGRMFVVEQPGRVRTISGGGLQPDAFLDLSALVNARDNERGLLGLAFHPQYARNGYFFVHYSATDGGTVVARYQVSADAQRADADSAALVLSQPQPYPNHNGGQLAFGPDGYLYLGLGDGGSAGDPQGNGQNLGTWLGKILRLDVDAALPYALPAANPFVAGGGLPEIWAYGLRNPWRFSFDRRSGDLFIADVGQGSWEEINFQPAAETTARNYGWDILEANHCVQSGCSAPGVSMPVAEYDHGSGCSVTGGYVYRGSSLPALQGAYIYGDYCSGTIWSLRPAAGGAWRATVLLQSELNISSFGEDEAGELYVVHHGGSVFRLGS